MTSVEPSESAWWAGLGGRALRRNVGWSDGYTADTTYTDLINIDLCPAWLSMISVLNGEPPIDPERPLVWLDLGCGTGLGTCVVAAGNPGVEVWGADYNPAHVERGRDLARRAGLANCHFVEASFEELAQDQTVGPDQVDVVIVNGVYSWVSAANQQHLVTTIRHRLRPGGLAYVMYESPAGWSSMTPLAEVLRLAVDADGRRADLAFHDAAVSLVGLRENGARYFPIGRREMRQMDDWAQADGKYAAHEYLGANFRPVQVDEVFSALASAKCSFIGGIAALDHHPYFSTPAELADLFDAASDPVIANLVLDLAIERPLRRDLFRRGRPGGTGLERRAWVHDLTFGGLGRPFDEAPIELTAMPVTLDPAYHMPLLEALVSNDLDIDAALAIHPDWTVHDALTGLALLVAGGYAAPLTHGRSRGTADGSCRRLNAVLLAEQDLGSPAGGLASPATGAMVAVDEVEALVLSGLGRGLPPDIELLADHVSLKLGASGRGVRSEGSWVAEPAAARALISERVRLVLLRRPSLARLGVYEGS